MFDQMDLQTRTSTQQKAEEDKRLFAALDKIASEGFEPR
jgi:hypothetical protein